MVSRGDGVSLDSSFSSFLNEECSDGLDLVPVFDALPKAFFA